MTGVGLRSPQAGAEGGRLLAVQPIGSYEQHGPHLPLATDAVIATELARRAVERLTTPAWLLPTMPYGRSDEHLGRSGTVTLTTATLAALCVEIARSVAASGATTLVFVNGHGGNVPLLQDVCFGIRAAVGLRAHAVHAPSMPLELPVPNRGPDFHAAFYETSAMLAIAPETVGPLPPPTAPRLPEHRLRRDPWHIDDVSDDGVIGDPTGADTAWGHRNLSAQATALAAVLTELAGLR